MSDHIESPPASSTLDARQPTAPAESGVACALGWALRHFEEVVTAVLLGVMIASIGLGVLFRYALRSPLSWTEEVVLLCMVWACFLGASIATKHKEHIVIDILVSLAPRRVAQAMEVLSLSVVIAVLALLVWQGIRLVEVTQDVTTTALDIPTMYIYAAVPASALLMLIHTLRQFRALLRR